VNVVLPTEQEQLELVLQSCLTSLRHPLDPRPSVSDMKRSALEMSNIAFRLSAKEAQLSQVM
jgi:hypothetical protein